MAANAVPVATAHFSDSVRRVSPSERMQLKMARTLGLPPNSLPDGSLPASSRLAIDSGTTDTQPGQVAAEECLALVRAFSRIRDPKVRHNFLQMIEAAADPEED
jgi:hypothetical protein